MNERCLLSKENSFSRIFFRGKNFRSWDKSGLRTSWEFYFCRTEHFQWFLKFLSKKRSSGIWSNLIWAEKNISILISAILNSNFFYLKNIKTLRQFSRWHKRGNTVMVFVSLISNIWSTLYPASAILILSK